MAKTRDPETDLIAKNMREFRDAAGLTAEDVATFCDVPIDSLRRYEAGKSGVPYRVLAKLAEVYGHKMEDFKLEKPPRADLTGRPGVALLTLPGVEVDKAALSRIQKLVEQVNAEMRAAKKSKR